MLPRPANLESVCDPLLIPAYIDGELDGAGQRLFESHMDDCDYCRSELLLHKQFICELDAALISKDEMSMPVDFSRVIAARAVSDMSGVRSLSENKRSIVFCMLLGIAGVALLGASTRQVAVTLGGRLITKVIVIIDLTWHTLYDVVLSLAVISRALSRKFIVETGNTRIVLLLGGVFVLLLSRLIFRYHRRDAIE